MWLGSPQRTTALSSAWDGVPGGWLPAGACVREHEGRWHLGEMEVTPNEGSTPQPRVVDVGLGEDHAACSLPLGRTERLGI